MHLYYLEFTIREKCVTELSVWFAQRLQYGAVEGDFALGMSLYHGYDLLQLHGLRSLYNYIESLVTGEKGFGRTKTELMRNADFRDLLDNLRGKFKPIQNANPHTQFDPVRASQQATPFVAGHPKMDKLCEIVLEHFTSFKAGESFCMFNALVKYVFSVPCQIVVVQGKRHDVVFCSQQPHTCDDLLSVPRQRERNHGHAE